MLAVQGTGIGLAGAKLAAFGAPAPRTPRTFLAPPGSHRISPLSPVPQRNSYWLGQVAHTAATCGKEGNGTYSPNSGVAGFVGLSNSWVVAGQARSGQDIVLTLGVKRVAM